MLPAKREKEAPLETLDLKAHPVELVGFYSKTLVCILFLCKFYFKAREVLKELSAPLVRQVNQQKGKINTN